MPPIGFVAITAASCVIAGARSTATVATPALVAPGDTLLFLVASNNISTGALDPALLPAGWSLAAVLTGTSTMLTVARRTATSAEPATHVMTALGNPTIAAALIAYRGADTGAAIATPALNNITTSTAFACPSQTNTTYSDLYIGVAFAISTPVFIAPANTNDRLNTTIVFNGTTSVKLDVFDLLTEQVTTSGNKTVSASVTSSGLAASMRIIAGAAPTLPVVAADVQGAIGFVNIGV